MDKFVPDNFIAPLNLGGTKFVIRALKLEDVKKDYQAVMSNVLHLRRTPTPPRCVDWPKDGLSLENNIEHVKRHQEEHENGVAFTYTILSQDEKECVGCIYILPSESVEFDADIYFWLIEKESKEGGEQRLFQKIKGWFESEWSFNKIRFPGRKEDGGFLD